MKKAFNKKEDLFENAKSKDKKENQNSNTNSNTNKDNNKIQVYSDIGYIQIDKAEYQDSTLNLVNFEKKNHKMDGRVSKSHLTEKISVNLKTLYGSRKVYTFEVEIKSKISCLIDMLVEEELLNCEKQKWNPNYQYRLISTNGLIKELNPMLSFIDEEIKNNFTLILASPYKLFFSETMKHQGIYVSCNLKLYIV